MNKKTIGLVVAALVIVIGLIWGFSGSSKAPQAGKEVKIGVILPLTGGAAFLGESAQKAAELALKDAGQTRNTYTLVFEDDAFNPVKTVSAVNKLTSLDKVSSIITFGSGTSNAAAPVNEAAKVPRFGLASDPTSAKGDYNYVNWTPPFKEGELLAQELVKRGYKKVAFVTANHPGTRAVAEAAKAKLAGTGVEVVSDEISTIGDKDFRTVINKIKSTKPDMIVLELFSPEIELFAKQAKNLALNVPLTSVESFEWSSEPELFEGMWFISDAKIDPAFAEKFKAAYKSEPKPGATYVYDIVTLMIKMQENSKDVIAAKDIPAAIAKMGSYESTVFGRVPIDADGFFITGASVKIMKGGKGVLE